MISFRNTEIAFQYYNNNSLLKAYWLFRMMNSRLIVKAGIKIIDLSLKLHLPISWLLKPTIFKHFCGGESLQEASTTLFLLKKYNVKTILDYSVEDKENEEGFTNAFNEILATIEFAEKNSDVPFIVFKPSALASRTILEKVSNNCEMHIIEKSCFLQFKNRINELCLRSSKANVPIMIDAEHSYYQKCIDEICEEMMFKYNTKNAIVFNTLQMYRTDRISYLHQLYKKSIEQGFFIGIKFVRGAYMEKERERAIQLYYTSPIFSDKQSTDNSFNEALLFSINHIDRISIFNGTHNEFSCQLLTELMKGINLANNDNRIWFSQLYGMSDNISFNLANSGYNVAKYVPYGRVAHVIPYLMRRAEENTSVKGQASREFTMIKSEIARRKN
jgi:proline dehydrogenase